MSAPRVPRPDDPIDAASGGQVGGRRRGPDGRFLAPAAPPAAPPADIVAPAPALSNAAADAQRAGIAADARPGAGPDGGAGSVSPAGPEPRSESGSAAVPGADARTDPGAGLLALVPVRHGQLPLGADETVAEAGGRVWLVGSGVVEAAATLAVAVRSVRVSELGEFAPAAWARALAPALTPETVVVLPASADGRDLAPRLAHVLARPLVAGAVRIDRHGATIITHHGGVETDLRLGGPVVATLVPGSRGVAAPAGGPSTAAAPAAAMGGVESVGLTVAARPEDPQLVELLGPDPSTVDLAEARRIVAGGQGLAGPDDRTSTERFDRLAAIGARFGASLGGTRVATDAGWLPFERQIGTTGVAVNPRLYLAFGISGAVQHVTGLGDPDHVISVNLDPSCPMMGLADLAVVSDARAVLDELARLLGVDPVDAVDRVEFPNAGGT